MGINRTYFCTLCRATMEPNKLHGIDFLDKGFKKGNSRECETHLCQDCLDSAAAIKKEYDEMRPVMNQQRRVEVVKSIDPAKMKHTPDSSTTIEDIGPQH